MSARIPIYVSHPLGGGADRDRLRAQAAAWVAWLARRYRIAPVADWIILAGQWDESMREDGLECDRALVELVGLVVLCGPRVSPGMALEAGWARRVADLSGCACVGVAPPGQSWGEWRDAADARMRALGVDISDPARG